MTSDVRKSPGPTLSMLGAVRTVTGSKFLLEHGGDSVLFDCGLFQGGRELRQRNWEDAPIGLRGLDAIVLSHAHLDHCGYLPRLVAHGYRGPVHVTEDTARLMAVVLPDSARLLEEEAEYANRAGYSRHDPALPLYTEEDAFAALQLCVPHPFDVDVDITEGTSVRFQPAGHILGSATMLTRLTSPDTSIRFSGDLGRSNHPLLVPPAPIGDVDWLVVESTYGNRNHDDHDPAERLADVIERTIRRGGRVIIPAFAVDRTEVILYHLAALARSGRLPHVPVYVDSPMALSALRVYRDAIERGAHDLRADVPDDVFDVPHLSEVYDTDGSKAISAGSDPAIIIAGSGMATGGRVIHHLAKFLPDSRNTVVLVGFQATGTRGWQLLNGVQELKIHGRYVRVRAEICDLTGFSVHADADALIDWVRTSDREPHGIFVVHGEEEASKALAHNIHDQLDWSAVVPRDGERLSLRR